LFTSLVFGVLYLWLSAPNWPPTVMPETNLSLALASVAARGSLRALAAGRAPLTWIGIAGVALLAAIIAVAVLIGNVIPHPREHALGATAAALLGYLVLHAGIGLLFLISNYTRIVGGFLSPRRLLDLRLTKLWIDYTALTGALAIGLVSAFPALVGVLGMRQ
jgi:cytochrome c oxidase subunit I+III